MQGTTLKSRVLHIQMLDTSENLQQWNLELTQIESRLGRLVATAAHIPIYLVNPLTMDCICPPRAHYSLEHLASLLKKLKYDREDNERKEEDVDRLFAYLEKARVYWWVATGCYVRDIEIYVQKAGLPEKLLIRETGPAIFLCPERIRKSAEEKNLPLASSFEFTLFHELGHAYMDTPPLSGIQQSARDIWEESLANGLAVEAYTENFRQIPIEAIDIIRTQPAEYQGIFPLVSDSFILRDAADLLTHIVTAGLLKTPQSSLPTYEWKYTGSPGMLIDKMMKVFIDLHLELAFLTRWQRHNIIENLSQTLTPYILDITAKHAQPTWQPYFLVLLQWWKNAEQLIRQHASWRHFFKAMAERLLTYICSGI